MNVFDAIASDDLVALEGVLVADPTQAAARDAHGVSAVVLARYQQRPAALECLLARAPSLDIFDAVAASNTTRVAQLLGIAPRLAVAWSSDGYQPLHLAAMFGEANAARLLMEHGADRESVARHPSGVRPLHAAAASGNYEALQRIVSRGVDVNARSAGGWTALHAAARAGNADMVKRLMEGGAVRSLAADDGQTATSLARAAGPGLPPVTQMSPRTCVPAGCVSISPSIVCGWTSPKARARWCSP